MRIQKPRELLTSLALFNDNIHVDEVMKRLEGTEKQTISLKHHVPVDITYLTAFVDPYGNLNFRRDVYHYDKYQMKDYAVKCVSLKGYKAPVSSGTKAKSDTPKASKLLSAANHQMPSSDKKPQKQPAAARATVAKTPPASTSHAAAPASKSHTLPVSKSHAAASALKNRTHLPTADSSVVRKVDGDGYNITEVY